MTMKHHNTKSRKMNDYYEDEEYLEHTSHKKESPRRRPVRNWKKAWVEHQTDYDEHEEFFGK